MLYSASGIDLLRSCERQFFYRYFMKKLTGASGIDCDAPKRTAMERGDIFHHAWEAFKEGKCNLDFIIEQTKKKVHTSINKVRRVKTVEPVFNIHEHTAIFMAMIYEYQQFLGKLKEETGLEELCLEIGFETKTTRGFIDAILYNPENGQWGIQDKKTRSLVSESSTANISLQPQYLFYYCHIREIIEIVFQRTKIKLDEKKFLGFYVCDIQCPSKNRKKIREADKKNVSTRSEKKELYDTVETVSYNDDCFQETLVQFYERLKKEKAVQVKQVFVPSKSLDAKDFWENQMLPTIERGMELESAFGKAGEVQGIKNTDNCINKYGSPCDYWSQCHGGKTYTETVYETESSAIHTNKKEDK